MTDILINSWTKGVLESVGADLGDCRQSASTRFRPSGRAAVRPVAPRFNRYRRETF